MAQKNVTLDLDAELLKSVRYFIKKRRSPEAINLALRAYVHTMALRAVPDLRGAFPGGKAPPRRRSGSNSTIRRS